MRVHRASITAQLVALMRAMHQHRPHQRRAHDDPYAELMITRPAWRWLMRSSLAHRLFDRINPAWIDFVSIRDRFADIACRGMSPAPRQVVALGAGLDTIVPRLQASGPGDAGIAVMYYEVDFPATQNYKLWLLNRLQRPWEMTNCRYVPTDFETDSLADSLKAAGFQSTLPTFVNWMGVTYYLTLESLRTTFKSLRELLAPGSLVVLDYTSPGSSLYARRSTRLTRWFHEPLHHALTAENLVPLAQEFGFVLELNLGDGEFARSLVSIENQWQPGVHLACLKRTDETHR